MTSERIPLFGMYWDERDVDSVTRVIRKGSYWATGPEIREFEERIAAYIGRKYCVAFNSGTSALHSCLMAHGICSGQVIVPSFSFISTATSVLLSGATPVFADIESDSFGLDPDDVAKRISQETKAIIPVHYAGQPMRRMDELLELAADHDILVIEDAAESFGSMRGGMMVGTRGDSSIFSFCQNKVITTGEGGMAATDQKKIYERLKLIGSHGRIADGQAPGQSADHILLGYNYRMPTMSAALGLSQLEKISDMIMMRRKLAGLYRQALDGIDDIILPYEAEGDRHVYQLFTIRVPKEKREGLRKHLEGCGISTGVYFRPIHLTSLFRQKYGCKEGDLPVTERISDEVLSIPIYPGLKEEQIVRIAARVGDHLR